MNHSWYLEANSMWRIWPVALEFLSLAVLQNPPTRYPELEPLGTCHYTEPLPWLYGLGVWEESFHELWVSPRTCLGAYGTGAGGEKQPVSIYFKIPRFNKFTFMTIPWGRTPARVQLTPALGVYREAGATEMNYGARPSREEVGEH